MREHRQHGWVEVSLDGRQVAGIVGGALVLLAIVFALGVGFGRQLAPAAPAPVAADLAKLDAPPPLPKVAPTPDTSFAFHEELKKAEPLHAVAPPAPKPVEPKPVEPKPVEPKPEPAAPALQPQAFAALVPPPPPAPEVPGNTAEKPVPPPAPAPAAEPGKKPAAPPPEPAKKPAEAGQWTVQFGSSSQRADADRLAAMLLDYGYAPFVAVADLPGKGRYYRVRVGRFASKEQAEKLRAEAQQKHRMAGVVMPAK